MGPIAFSADRFLFSSSGPSACPSGAPYAWPVLFFFFLCWACQSHELRVDARQTSFRWHHSLLKETLEDFIRTKKFGAPRPWSCAFLFLANFCCLALGLQTFFSVCPLFLLVSMTFADLQLLCDLFFPDVASRHLLIFSVFNLCYTPCRHVSAFGVLLSAILEIDEALSAEKMAKRG